MLRSFARTFASSGIFLLFPLFVQAQALSFSVGTATAAPGQKSTGYLEVPAGVDAATNIPVIVINGEKRGPVLALVSGAHGTEYPRSSRLKNSSTYLIPLKSPAPLSLSPSSTFNPSNKRSPMLTLGRYQRLHTISDIVEPPHGSGYETARYR
jgi:hypothetical protein